MSSVLMGNSLFANVVRSMKPSMKQLGTNVVSITDGSVTPVTAGEDR